MDGLDKTDCPQETPAGSHQTREGGLPPRSWKPRGDDEGNEDSVCEMLKEETMHTVCKQAARNISVILGAELRGGLQAALREEVLGAELRGGLQAALREEVSRAVREEFQRCSQELRELRTQRILVENACQADGHAQSDGNLPRPTQASSPQSQTSSTHGLPRLPVMPHPWAHTVATANRGQKLSLPRRGEEASRGQRLMLPTHGDEAHHHTDSGDSVASGASNSGQSIVDEEQSVIPVRHNSQVRVMHELLQRQGLEGYAADMTAPQSSSSSPQARTRPVAGQNSRSRTRTSPSSQAGRRACLTGADPREGEEGAGAKPPTRLSQQDSCELGSHERTLTGELFRARDIHPPGDDDREEVSSFHLLSFSGSSRDLHSEQDLRRSLSHQWGQPLLPQGTQGSLSSNTSMRSPEEVARREISIGAAERATEAVQPDISIAGSQSQSTFEMQRMRMEDAGLVREPSLDDSDGELDDVEAAPPDDRLEACSWFVALAADICSLLGGLIVPACAIIPWEPTYPVASTLYQWIILGLVGKSLYCSVSMTYMEWEMGEPSRAVVLALDSVMGMGALVCIFACGALWRSRVLVECCKLLMAYACKVGVLAHWEEVSVTDFLCTFSFWFTSVLTVTFDSVYFEVFATTEELLSHVGGFSLFAFVLLGVSQFIVHMCRCLTKMIDTFCFHIIERPDFAEALREWGLLHALCRTACSSIQLAFVSLQATATAIALLSIQQVGCHDTSRFMCLLPGLIVATGVYRAALWAAGVTDKCIRVPMLVNSVPMNRLLDQERMYTVHHIVYSQAGFYVYDLRVTSSIVLKTAYIACAVTFYLASRVFVE